MFGNWSYGTIVFTVLVFTVTLKVIKCLTVVVAFPKTLCLGFRTGQKKSESSLGYKCKCVKKMFSKKSGSVLAVTFVANIIA